MATKHVVNKKKYEKKPIEFHGGCMYNAMDHKYIGFVKMEVQGRVFEQRYEADKEAMIEAVMGACEALVNTVFEPEEEEDKEEPEIAW